MQAKKTKTAMVRKGDSKVHQIKKIYEEKTKSGIEGNDIEIKDEVSGSRNINIILV